MAGGAIGFHRARGEAVQMAGAFAPSSQGSLGRGHGGSGSRACPPGPRQAQQLLQAENSHLPSHFRNAGLGGLVHQAALGLLVSSASPYMIVCWVLTWMSAGGGP